MFFLGFHSWQGTYLCQGYTAMPVQPMLVTYKSLSNVHMTILLQVDITSLSTSILLERPSGPPSIGKIWQDPMLPSNIEISGSA